MKFPVYAMVAAAGCILLASGKARAETAPVACETGVVPQMLRCEVSANAEITKIVLNGGQCPITELPEKARHDFQDIWATQSLIQQLFLRATVIQAISRGMDTAHPDLFEGWTPERNVKAISKDVRELAAFYFLSLNPVGVYPSGSDFTITLVNCNATEWTMTINGKDWTGQVQ